MNCLAAMWARWCMGSLVLALVLSVAAACATEPPEQAWQTSFDEAEDWELSADAAADVALVDGQLHIHIFEPGQVAWASVPREFEDFRLKVTAMQISGPADNEYGVLVRMDGPAHFYAFSVSGDGYVRAARYDEDAWTLLGGDWAPSNAVLQGEAANVLEVEARGAQYVFRVNGQDVLQVEDAECLKGGVGLYAGAFAEAEVVVAFDDLEIFPLEPVQK